MSSKFSAHHEHTKKWCHLCQKTHAHVSQAALRNIQDGKDVMYCYRCRVDHPKDLKSADGRLVVFLSSSTLHGVCLLEDASLDHEPVQHFDVETISGARLHHLRDAWRRGYGNMDSPIDLFIIGGLNDVASSDFSHDNFMQTLTSWRSEVFRKNSDSTFRMYTVIMPPQCCCLEKTVYTGVRPIDKTMIFDALNEDIRSFNKEVGIDEVGGFDQMGHRGKKQGRNRRQDFGQWRECVQTGIDAAGYHLVDRVRLSMWRKMVNHMGDTLLYKHVTRT